MQLFGPRIVVYVFKALQEDPVYSILGCNDNKNYKIQYMECHLNC